MQSSDSNPTCRLASVEELRSIPFTEFMSQMNNFAARHGLRQFSDWSKVWEYPWLWFHALSNVDWETVSLVDLGSELSPMPWYLASLGAKVTLVESDPEWEPRWNVLKNQTGYNVNWCVVSGDEIPCADVSADVVTSFSVIEHQADKRKAISEVARILKPGGLFALSFDICEPDRGMTFPEWNGSALTMADFESLVWNNQAFTGGALIGWNTEDIADFVAWHLKSAPHHNYTVGACFLSKR